ncbi:Uncharacterised protein [Vibrio cholerae]|nr:Uncharacterised protein [Vibrio cholerae]
MRSTCLKTANCWLKKRWLWPNLSMRKSHLFIST